MLITLIILCSSLALHVAAVLAAWRAHSRARRQHLHASIPVIGTDHALTKAMHQRLAQHSDQLTHHP